MMMQSSKRKSFLLAGQREDDLVKAMRDYKNNTRRGYDVYWRTCFSQSPTGRSWISSISCRDSADRAP